MKALTIADLRDSARRRLPKAVFDYIDGGAGDEVTLRRNVEDFDLISLLPRILVDVSVRDLAMPILGRTAPLPIIVAPTGLAALARHRADGALARAAAAHGVPIVLSSNSSISIEDFAREGPDCRRWFQTYLYKDRELIGNLVERALAADYEALVVTVDVPVLGQRDRDQRNGFTIPLRLSPRLVWDVLRCPGWSVRLAISGAPRIANFVQPGSPQPAASMIKFINSKMDPSASWAEAEWLRRRWPRKLVIKGILSPADAARAVDLGFDAIAVSNHGGRQADGSLSAISALPAVVDAVAGRAEIYLDGGIRRGTSIAKALALGASAVMMGRPTLYGVAADGEAGANAALSILREEFDRCLALIGCPVARSLDRSFIVGGLADPALRQRA